MAGLGSPKPSTFVIPPIIIMIQVCDKRNNKVVSEYHETIVVEMGSNTRKGKELACLPGI